MGSKISVIVAFVIAIAILVDGFSYFFVRQPVLRRLDDFQRMTEVTATPTLEPTLTATPTAALKMILPSATRTVK